MSIVPLYCLSHLPALQRARSQSPAADLVSGLHRTLEVEGGEAGGAAEQLRPGSLENPEVQMWVQIELKNLMRSGFLGLPAFGLSSVLNINELSVF